MEPWLYLLLFSIFFILTGTYVWKRDVLYGGIYLFLYIYTIFSQIGYTYFPSLSIFIKAYFGSKLFYEFHAFIFLSFLAYFLIFRAFYKKILAVKKYKIVKSNIQYFPFFVMVVLMHILFLGFYLFLNYDSISYVNMSNENYQRSHGSLLLIFSIFFKLSVMINIILYYLIKCRRIFLTQKKEVVIYSLFLLEIVVFVIIAVKIGNRTDPLALSLSIVVLEICFMRIYGVDRMRIVKIISFFVLVIYGLIVLEVVREGGTSGQKVISEIILLKDYFAPSHMLFAAMAFEYVDIGEVVISNTSNALIKINHPYLQATITNLINPGIASRSTGYAFYIFSEGYLALGWYGFIYNGIIIFLGVTLWRLLGNSSFYLYNVFIISLLASQMANIVRSQSSYFIKDIYTLFIPAMFIFFLATGYRPLLGVGGRMKRYLVSTR